jgi:molybdate transport system substrate-binding protein
MQKIFLFLLCLCLGAQAIAAQTTIAVAANFTDATRDLVPLFEQTTGHYVKVSFGSTGKLYSQIENGAPYEVFLAADDKRPAKVENDGLAVSGTRFTYAQGKLALWSSSPGLFKDGEVYLTQNAFKRVAIANPKTAPYGLAAQQVMEHLGMWDMLQSKIVRGDSIAQTFQFVATGNAQVGFVAFSQVKAWSGVKGSFWEIPANYHGPIAQQAVLLKNGEDNPAAKAFLEFLKSPKAREVITSYGYGTE